MIIEKTWPKTLSFWTTSLITVLAPAWNVGLQRGGTCFQSFAEDGKWYAAMELQRLGRDTRKPPDRQKKIKWFQLQHFFHSSTSLASPNFRTRFASESDPAVLAPRLLYAHSRSVAGHFSSDSWNCGWQPGAEQHLSAGANDQTWRSHGGLVRW